MVIRKFKLSLNSYRLSAGILDHRDYDQTIEIASTEHRITEISAIWTNLQLWLRNLVYLYAFA